MTGSVSHVLSLTCAIGFILGNVCGASQLSTGLKVLLPNACDNHGDGRDLVVRYLPGGKLWLNGDLLKENELRSELQKSLATRVEKLVWVAADEHVHYGEVIALLSKLRQDNPGTYIALTTKTQTGPVDPADPGFRKAQLNPKLGIYRLCVYVPGINDPVRSTFQ
jgi:biopolymer transport protein ExbD